MRKLIASLLIVAQLISLSPAWGAPTRDSSLQEAQGYAEERVALLQREPLDRGSIQSGDDNGMGKRNAELARRGQAAHLKRDPANVSLESLDTLTSQWSLSPSQVTALSRPSLGSLYRMEATACRFPRWVTVANFLPHLAAFPMVGQKDIRGGERSPSNRRIWISGESLPLTEAAFKRVRGAQQFIDLTISATSTLIHSAFTLLLGSQLIYAAQHGQPLRDVPYILWNGDSNSIQDFYGLVQNLPQAQALFALAATPLVIGLVGGIIEGATTSFLKPETLESLLEEKENSPSRSGCRSFWSDTLRWWLPFYKLPCFKSCHRPIKRLQALQESLLWDGTLTLEQRQKIKDALFTSLTQSRGYSRVFILEMMKSLVSSLSLPDITRLNLTPEERVFWTTLKMEALEALRKHRDVHPFYAGMYLWELGDPHQHSCKKTLYWLVFLGRLAWRSLILKTIIEGVIQILNCPSPVGQTWTGPASWASDYTYECFQAYMSLFNQNPGQPPETLTDLFPLFHFTDEEAADFTFSLAGNGITDAKVIAQIFRNFTAIHPEVTVTTLNMSGNGFGNILPDTTSALAPLFHMMPHLRALDLSKNGIGQLGDNDTQVLGDSLRVLTALTSLNLGSNDLGSRGDLGIQAIGESLRFLSALTSLNLQSTLIGLVNDTGTQVLGNSLRYLPALTSLNLGSPNIGAHGDAGTQAIGESLRFLTALTSLDLGNTLIGLRGDAGTQAIGESLRSLTALTSLNLGNSLVGYTNDTGVRAIGESLGSLTALTSLNLGNGWIGNQGDGGTKAIGESLRSLTALTSLNLENTLIGFRGDAGIQAIGDSLRHLTALTSLNLGSNGIDGNGDAGAQAIGNSLQYLSALTLLDLSGNHMDSTRSNTLWPLIVSNIMSLPRLTILNVVQALPHLEPPLSLVQTLRIFWNKRSGIADFMEFVNVEDITSYLDSLPASTTTLNLSNQLNALGDPEGALAVASFLPRFTELQVLDVSSNRIGQSDEGIQALGNSLRYLPALTFLNLGNSRVGFINDTGTQAIGESLRCLTALASLNLGGTYIGLRGDAGIQAIGESLRSLTALTSLNLGNSQIGVNGDEGTQAIGESLRSLTALTSLNLGNSWIGSNGDAGTQAIGESLRSLTALTSLNLGNSWIGSNGDAGTQAIGQSLLFLANLQTLNLGNDLIGTTGPAGPAAILNAIPVLLSHNLTQVDVTGMTNVTWTEAANAFEILTSRQLQGRCEAALCHGGSLDNTTSSTRGVRSGGLLLKLLEGPDEEREVPEHPLRLTPHILQATSVASTLRPFLLFTVPFQALRPLGRFLTQQETQTPADEETPVIPSANQGEDISALPSYPAHTAVAGGVGLLLLGKGFYDVGKALTQVGRNLWALAVQKYTGQSPEGFLLSGDMRDRKLSKVNALFTSLLEKSRTERYQDTVWAWWLEDHQDEWEKLQRIIPLFRKTLQTFKRKLKQFAQDWELFEQSQQTSSSQEPA